MKFGFLWKLHLTLCGQNLDARERLCPVGKAPTPAVRSLTPRGRHLGLSISGRVASKQLAAGFGGGQITAVPSLSSKFQDLAPGLPCVSSSLCQLPSRQGGHSPLGTLEGSYKILPLCVPPGRLSMADFCLTQSCGSTVVGFDDRITGPQI